MAGVASFISTSDLSFKGGLIVSPVTRSRHYTIFLLTTTMGGRKTGGWCKCYTTPLSQSGDFLGFIQK